MFVARNNSRARRFLCGTGAAALLAALACGPALGQAAGGDSDEVEQVNVPGSRIATPGFQTPNPVTEISPLQYDVKQVTSLVDLLGDVPSLTINQNRVNVADVGASQFDLHGVGAGRTLVLVDGQRTAPTSVNGGFDINVLPESLVQHVQIVSGGASAAYGSDAIAGVVNVVLNTTLDGLRGRAGYGQSAYGDDQTFTGSAAWGMPFLGGRGHVVVGGDYAHQLGVDAQDLRPWGRNNWGLIANSACTTITTSCAQLLVSPNVVPSQVADGGVILTAGPLKDTAFGAGGAPIPFTVGADAGTIHMIGGSGSLLDQILPLQPAATRANLLAHATYDVTEDLGVWAQLLYNKSTETTATAPNDDDGTIVITNQNPFIPASILAVMAANKITQLQMGRANYDLGTQESGRENPHGINEDYAGSAGLTGKFNAFGGDWSWDWSGQYFSNAYTSEVAQNRIEANWTNALDAVANPAIGGVAGVAAGQPVCRSTLTAPTNGCVPADIFGTNTITAAVRNYVTGTSWTDAQITMLDTDANLRGEPFSTWAGPVSLAAGVEYRRQASQSQSDPVSQIEGWHFANFVPYKGAYSVEGGYVEFGVPLARNAPWAVALDLDTAARLTSYSTSGGVASWKIGLNYSPDSDLRLRASRSHDIHGPDLQQLFETGLLRAGTNVTNPTNNVTTATTTITSGNPNLAPEIGDTYAGGVVYSPAWLRNFNISADYWNIKVSRGFAGATEQQVVTNCFAGQAAYCPAISFTGAAISKVLSTFFNAGLLKSDGWDFETAYQFEVGDVMPGWDGSLRLRALATYVNHLTSGSFGATTDEAGCVGACGDPHLRYNLNAIYLNAPWTVSLTGNWLGGGAYDQLYSGRYTAAQGGATISDNKVDGRFYVNLSVAYQWTDQWQIFGRVNNLLNTNPPIVPDAKLDQYAVGRGAVYDRIGLLWLAGVKVSME